MLVELAPQEFVGPLGHATWSYHSHHAFAFRVSNRHFVQAIETTTPSGVRDLNPKTGERNSRKLVVKGNSTFHSAHGVLHSVVSGKCDAFPTNLAFAPMTNGFSGPIMPKSNNSKTFFVKILHSSFNAHPPTGTQLFPRTDAAMLKFRLKADGAMGW
ncbi:hypothetical protein Pla22_16940 [Rubripirellula amarantea]|uniref:Uncharacterized protein n=1 Tax=Rubripirellula amarantea TaxID=2527999 RepID=A0A5C5WUX7_9BACT|nr:hypothetical protein Pla22_16940 [Rubripirellula amarantea]